MPIEDIRLIYGGIVLVPTSDNMKKQIKVVFLNRLHHWGKGNEAPESKANEAPVEARLTEARLMIMKHLRRLSAPHVNKLII